MLVTGSAGAVCSANAAPLVELVGDPVIDDVIDDAPVFCSSSSSSYVDNWKTKDSQFREVNNAFQTRFVAVCYHCFLLSSTTSQPLPPVILRLNYLDLASEPDFGLFSFGNPTKRTTVTVEVESVPLGYM